MNFSAIDAHVISLLCAADAELLGLHEALRLAGFKYKATARTTKGGGLMVRIAWRKRKSGTSLGFTGNYHYSALDVKTAQSLVADLRGAR